MLKELDGLIAEGLVSAFETGTGYYYKDTTIKSELGVELLNNEAFIPYFERLSRKGKESGDYRILNKIARTFIGREGLEPSLFWRNKFVSYSDVEYIRQNANAYIRGEAPRIEYGISLSDSTDTFQILNVVHPLVSGYNWVNTKYSNLLARLVEDNPLSLKLFAHSTVFAPGKGRPKPCVRGEIYRRYIEAGFLDAKTARKMRSDASSEASMYGLRALIANEDEYENYTDLLLAFTDSRHRDVLCELARSLPIYLVSSLLGCNDEWVKRIVENRMNSGE